MKLWITDDPRGSGRGGYDSTSANAYDIAIHAMKRCCTSVLYRDPRNEEVLHLGTAGSDVSSPSRRQGPDGVDSRVHFWHNIFWLGLIL
jgi:hypothetical protein